MVGQLIIRGLLVGIVAGLLAFAYANVFGEPTVDAAIAFEEQLAAAEPADPNAVEEPAIVSRDVQRTIGLMTGIVGMGIAFGGIFAVLFALANGRIGRLTPSQTSVLLAALCFLAISLVPWLKYPANPPASTFDDTVQFRSAVYFLMLALSIAAVIGAWLLRQALVTSQGAWMASLTAGIAYVAVVGILLVVMPSISEVPEGFPATTMFDFRLAALGIQAILWGGIGVIFGLVVERTMSGLAVPPGRAAMAR